jgi:hypothetical protein
MYHKYYSILLLKHSLHYSFLKKPVRRLFLALKGRMTGKPTSLKIPDFLASFLNKRTLAEKALKPDLQESP